MLSLPKIQGRYYVMPFMDAWSNVFAMLGPGSTGSDLGVRPAWAAVITHRNLNDRINTNSLSENSWAVNFSTIGNYGTHYAFGAGVAKGSLVCCHRKKRSVGAA